MKKVRTTVIFMIMLICGLSSFAQNGFMDSKDLSNVNIDNYSDNQILSLYNQAQASGLSNSELIHRLSDKGMPSSEINKLKVRLEAITSTKKSDIPDQPVSSQPGHIYDTAGKAPPVETFQNDNSIFGSELF